MFLRATPRTVLSFAGATLLAALIVVPSFWALQRSKETAAERKHTSEVLKRANALLSDMKDAEDSQRGYALTGDEALLGPYLAARTSVPGHLAELRQRTLVRIAQRHLDALAPLIAARFAELSHAIDLRRAGDVRALQAAVIGSEGRRLMDSIQAELAAFTAIEERALALHDAAFQSSLRTLFALIVTASVGMLLLVLSFTYMVSRDGRHRLKRPRAPRDGEACSPDRRRRTTRCGAPTEPCTSARHGSRSPFTPSATP